MGFGLNGDMECGELLHSFGYQNIVFIGEGLNSWVYRGNLGTVDGLVHAPHVLKVSKSTSEIQEFENIYRLISKVRSKYCPAVLGIKSFEGRKILIMDHVEGVSLAMMASLCEFDLYLIDEVIAQIQEALQDIHEQGVVHGDLHPNNILVDRSGRIQLIDYGLMQSRQFEGAPAYIAPELWNGEPVSKGSDYFALAMLYEDLLSWNHLGVRTVLELKRRAFNSLDEADLWRLTNPMCRGPKPGLKSSPDCRKRLASLVSKTIFGRSQNDKGTQVIRNAYQEAIVQLKKINIVLLLASVFACVPVSVPPKHEQIKTKFAELRVQTLNWVQISLNGMTPQYAPVTIRTLSPGEIRLDWKTKNRKGRMLLILKPGDTKMLSDNDF